MNTSTEHGCRPDSDPTLRSSEARVNYLTVFVLLILISLTSAFLNILLLVTMLMWRRLRTISNKLIMMLATSDLAIAIATVPLLAAREMKHYLGTSLCWAMYPLAVEGYSFTFLSLVTVGLIALEQCLAISYPYFYERSVRFRYMATPAIIMWVVFTVFAVVVVRTSGPWRQRGETVSAVLYVVICLAILTCYLKIYFVAKDVRQKIAKTNKEEAERIKQRARVSKTSAIILLVVFVCYIPRFITKALRANNPHIFRSVDCMDSWWDMIALSDCLWDVVICFWRITQLREHSVRLLCRKSGYESPRGESRRKCISPHERVRNEEQLL